MIKIYTDGSSLDQTKKIGNKRGGAAFIVVDGDNVKYNEAASHYNVDVTNNTMEMSAMIMAIEHCIDKGYSNATIYSDSKYVVNGINEWMEGWKDKGWKKKSGVIANIEIWKHIDKLVEKSPYIKYEWVRGHDGHEHNEAVDKLAYGAATVSEVVCIQ